MRAIVVHPGPNFSVADVHAGWVEALTNLGVDVLDLNFSERLEFYSSAHLKREGEFLRAFDDTEACIQASKGIEVAAFEWWPDFVLIISAFYVPRFTFEILQARGMKVVLLHTEVPYENDAQVERAAFADLNLLNDPTGLERFEAVAPSYYSPHAYRPTVHLRRAPKPESLSDFCFVGTGFPSRIEFFEQVDWQGIDVALAGNWQALPEGSPLRSHVLHPLGHCVDNAQAVELYNGTEVSANLYRKEAQRPELSAGWAMGPREVELAACRTFFLREPRGEGDEVLDMLPTFTEPAEFEDKLRYYLAHETERLQLAHKAQEAITDRTFENQAKRLLARLS